MKISGIFIGILTVFTAFIQPEYGAVYYNIDFHDTTGYLLVKKSRGIELYEKWDSIDSETMAREVKAVFTVKAEPRLAALLLQDQTKGRKWNKNSSEYKVIKGDSLWICYIQYDLPWPVRNQDCVLKYTEEYLSDKLMINFNSIDHARFPKRPRVERINEVSGKWVLTKTTTGTQVEYFITTTPSKILPAWVTDPIIRNNLLNTLMDFRTILESHKELQGISEKKSVAN